MNAIYMALRRERTKPRRAVTPQLATGAVASPPPPPGVMFLLLCLFCFSLLSPPLLFVEAALFPRPNVLWRATPSNFVGDSIAEGNGVVIENDSSQALITTEQGKLLGVSLLDSAKTEVSERYAAPARPGYSTTCQSSVVLYGEFALYAVVDVSPDETKSRIFQVPTNHVAATDPSDLVRTIDVDGAIKGTPLINADGHLFVAHHVDLGEAELNGQMSIFDLENDAIGIVSANTGEILAPPAMTRVTLDSGDIVDWVVMAANIGDGNSNQGDVYALRFDPVTFAAVWHILGLNIGGSSKKAAGISRDGTTIVFGTDRDFVKAWVNNQNIRNILHFSDTSNLSDVSFDIDVRLSRSDEPTNTQPVLLGGAYALISERDANLVALDLLDGGATEWTLQTRTAHSATPIVVNDDEAGRWVIYDLSQAGILRQFLVDYTNPSEATLSYAANCVGFINATSVGNNNNNLVEYTESQCGVAPATADFAVSSNGEVVVYATQDGSVTAIQVSVDGTWAPSSNPSATPTAAPSPMPSLSALPTAPPSGSPTASSSASPTMTALIPDGATPAPVSTVPSVAPSVAPLRGPSTPPQLTPPPVSNLPSEVPSSAPITNQRTGRGAAKSSSSNSSSLGLLSVLLGVVASVFLLAVVAVCLFMKRKRKDDTEEKARTLRDVELKTSRLNNKRQYEEEMRMEEEETLNDLMGDAQEPASATPSAGQVALSPGRNQRMSRRLSTRRRSNMAATSTLGSISESENEDDLADVSVTEGFRFEISIDAMEMGSGEVMSADGMSDLSVNERLPPITPPRRSATQDMPWMDAEAATNEPPNIDVKARTSASPYVPATVALSPQVKADNHSRWFAEVMSLRSSYFERNSQENETSMDSKESAPPDPVLAPGGHLSDTTASPTPATPEVASSPPKGAPEDEGALGIVRLTPRDLLHSSSPRVAAAKVSPNEERRATFAKPPRPMSPSDILSVDSSLYLEGNTITCALSPPGGGSVLTHMSDKSHGSLRSPEPNASIKEDTLMLPLSPLGSGSVASQTSEASQKSAAAAAPGAHYLGTGSGRPTPVPNQRNSPATDLERSASPTVRLSARRDLMYELADSPRATVHGTELPAYQSRGGLFSRRSRTMDRLLSQYESDATASASETETDDGQHSPTRITKPKLPKKRDSRSSTAPADSSISSGASKTTETTRTSTTASTSVWNSFLSELSKAENQFFNPSMPASEELKTRRLSRSLRDRSPDGPIPPPSSVRMNRRERTESPEPPPPPPYGFDSDSSDDSPTTKEQRIPSGRRLIV